MKRFFRAFILLIGTVLSVGMILIGAWADLKSVWEDFIRPVPLYAALIAFLAGGIAFYLYHLFSTKEGDSNPVQPEIMKKMEDQAANGHSEWIKPQTNRFPEHIRYTQDEIEGVLWKWEWFILEHKESGIRLLDIYKLKAICPRCKADLIMIQEVRYLTPGFSKFDPEMMKMFYDGKETGPLWLYCDREGCEFQKKRVDVQRIREEIHRRVESEDWKKERIQARH